MSPVDVDLLADRVAARLLAPLQATVVSVLERQAQLEAVQMVDAAELARVMGVSTAFVYEHAEELRVQRLGAGPRARLRFDVEVARAAFSRSTGSDSQAVAPIPRRATSRARPAPGSILAIKRAKP